ncbi:hypothetical protein [Streptomyces sp. 039-1]|uniref:hypothetical protein n=1 Tax=Streptomyces sp. 039-1 TaxID=2789263 RepID=UPI0039F4C298
MIRPVANSDLLCPEMFRGADAVPPSIRAAIAHRLEEVTEARGGLLHACGAFNSLYFDYDPRLRRYARDPDPDCFVTISAGGDLPVLPTGSFVRLTRGSRELWGEVAAVLGAAADVDEDGWTKAARSGAPADADRDRQRVLIDTDVFGPLSPSESIERGRWVRPGGGLENGQLLGSVPSTWGDISARDQIGSFAAYLAGPARTLLDVGPLPGWLASDSPAVSDADMARSIRTAVESLAEIMSTAPGLRTWGLYARPKAEAAVFAASEAFAEVRRSVCRPAPGDQARYSALWPLLDVLVGADGPGDGLGGVAGVALTIDANLALADATTSPSLPGGIDLRVDDVWQHGGIWRTQRLPVAEFLRALDPLDPAGIGFIESSDSSAPGLASGSSSAASREGDEPREREQGASRAAVVHIDDELVVLTAAVCQDDLTNGRLRLTRAVLDLLPPGELILQLHHDGAPGTGDGTLQQVRRRQDMLLGVRWPSSAPPGLHLTVAAARAGRRLVATSVRLAHPVDVAGFGTVRWECDETLFSLGTGLGISEEAAQSWEPWAPSLTRGSWRPAVAALEHLVVEALKRDGDQGPADSRRLDGRRLTAALFGPDVRSTALLWTVIHTCEDMAVLGLLTQSPGPASGPDVFTWWPSTPEADKARTAAEWGGDDGSGQPLSRRWIRPQRRRLPADQQASLVARLDYAKWRVEVEGADADTELPPGTTFVHGHLKGSGPGRPWHRHVPQDLEDNSGNG